MKPRSRPALAPVCSRPPQMKSPAWGRGAYINGAGGDWEASAPWVNGISHRECARPIIRSCAMFRLAGNLLLVRHSACSLTIVQEPSREHSRSPLYSGWGFRILDQWTALRILKGATAEGRAVPECGPGSHFDHFPAEQGERAMPMLFWLPMIFVSAWWEMNGFQPQALANNHPASTWN
jgi:hypothetical protein